MSCGLGTCVDPDCYLCTVVAKETQPRPRHWVRPVPDVAENDRATPARSNQTSAAPVDDVAAIRQAMREKYGTLL